MGILKDRFLCLIASYIPVMDNYIFFGGLLLPW